MALFLTSDEAQAIRQQCDEEPLRRIYQALLNRTRRRARTRGLIGPETTCPWWHVTAEYLTDAAMAWAVAQDESVNWWLREATLDIVRRPEDDWVGPPFRDHCNEPRIGHLETAHLSWAVAVVLDLAAELFAPGEREEIIAVLTDRAIPLCLRWFETNRHLANWRCIMLSGVGVPAAVLGNQKAMQRAAHEFRLNTEAFQPDGSYAESLQYANYAINGLMLTYEALVRRDSSWADQLPMEAYASSVRWFACSHFYNKPLDGWGEEPRPRAANFNDSAAIFRPSGDLLLHIAARAGETLPEEAGLARWLFDELYLPCPEQGPTDRMSFGFVNHFGFLTLPLLPREVAPLSPSALGLPHVAAFSNGDTLVRDSWPGRTILAVRTGGDPLHGPGHLHGDLNSLILVHNRERLLVDPGHSCYRNLIHDLEGSSLTHNTCTFTPVASEGRPLRHEEQMLPGMLQQERRAMRQIRQVRLEPPVDRGARRLLATQDGALRVVGSEAARLYGAPIEDFSRFCLLVGSQVLFVLDRIRASHAVKTTWNWLLNNRDGQLDLDLCAPKRLVARRGQAGMLMVHMGEGVRQGPLYGYVHDAYHPLPSQLGEGKPGSGQLVRWQEAQAQKCRVAAHTIVLDDASKIYGWQVEQDDQKWTVCDPSGSPTASIIIQDDPLKIDVYDQVGGKAWRLTETLPGQWRILPGSAPLA